MKINILTLTIIATAFLLISCEKEIEFNGDQIDPKLVINSLVEPGQPVKASISKSYFFLDEPDTAAPNDVVATLYVNGSHIGEMTRGYDTVSDGWIEIDDEGHPYYVYQLITVFKNDYQPTAGDIIKITASANGFDDVEGTTSPLPKTLDCQMEMEINSWHSSYYHPYFTEPGVYEEDSVLQIHGNMTLTFNINDPNPGVLDYFRLTSERWANDEGNSYYLSYDYDDPVFGGNFTENEFFDASDLDTRPEGVFTDVLFDGKSYQLKLKIYFEMNLTEEYDPTFFCVPFTLQHLSKEYYNYLNTCNQGDEIMQFFAEPIQTYTNVNGGFGLVGGRTMDIFWLALPLEE